MAMLVFDREPILHPPENVTIQGIQNNMRMDLDADINGLSFHTLTYFLIQQIFIYYFISSKMLMSLRFPITSKFYIVFFKTMKNQMKLIACVKKKNRT